MQTNPLDHAVAAIRAEARWLAREHRRTRQPVENLLQLIRISARDEELMRAELGDAAARGYIRFRRGVEMQFLRLVGRRKAKAKR